MSKGGVRAALWVGPVLGISVLAVALVVLQVFAGEPAAAHQPGAASFVPMSPQASTDALAGKAEGQGGTEGWQTVFSETFESGIGPGWIVTDTSAADGGEYTWGAGSFEPSSPVTAAWCVGGGADGSSLTPGVDDYPDHVDSWLIYGPVELTDAWDAYVQFSWWMEASRTPDGGDWLGWCVLTGPRELGTAECAYVSTSVGAWMRGVIPLGAHLPTPPGPTDPVWIGFRFVSDGDGQAGLGAFVDDVELRVNRGYRLFVPMVLATASASPAGPKSLVANGGFEEEAETFRRVTVFPGEGEAE